MAITAIARDLVSSANVVHVVSSDTLATCAGASYITNQTANITALNNGVWNWIAGDTVLVEASDGNSWFEFSGSDFSTLIAMPPAGSLSNVLTSGRIFVGSAGNVATGVAMSGAATISNTGAVSLANGAVLSANLSPLVIQYASVAISAADFNGMYAAPKLLVAAAGANTLLVVKQVQLLMTYNSAAYAAGGVAAVQYDSTVHGAGVIASTTQAAANFQATSSRGFVFNPGVVDEVFTTCVNKGLYLSNLTAAFTTGDSAMVAHVWYAVIPTV